MTILLQGNMQHIIRNIMICYMIYCMGWSILPSHVWPSDYQSDLDNRCVCEAGTKRRGASNMNIHYDVTGLLTAVWRSHSGQIVWAAWISRAGGGFWTHSTYTWYPGLDNRCVWSRYEKGVCEQHEYSLWRHRFTDCSVEVTLRSNCLGRLN